MRPSVKNDIDEENEVDKGENLMKYDIYCDGNFIEIET